MRTSSRIATWVMLSSLGLPALSHAKKDKAPAPEAPASSSGAGEMLEVEKVKEKYWAQGEDSKMGVVQNRLFSKEKKFAVGLLGGTSISDPFLSTLNYGGTLGYHFSEFVGVEMVGWKNHVKPSSALKTANDSGKEFNTNNVEWMMGAEVMGSFLYGKLSLLGQKILYYDMHLSGGLGVTHSQNDTGFAITNGNDRFGAVTYLFGLGQRFYITQGISFRVDYRGQVFSERILERVDTTVANYGKLLKNRTNFGHTLNLSFDYMFGI